MEEQIKMASQEESVREFVAVTDVDEERARFFLESAGWNLQVRLLQGSPPRPGASPGGERLTDSGERRAVSGGSRPASVSLCCR